MSEAARLRADLDDFDPFGLAFRQDPEAYYPKLIQQSPGFMLMEGVPSAYVASHPHSAAVLRDFKRFSSVKPPGLPGMERVDFFNSQPVMNYSDPPNHTRLRRVISGAFSPKRMQEMNESIANLVEKRLDEAAKQGVVEVMGDIARPIAYEFILSEFLGIPQEDQHLFQEYVKTLPLLDLIRPGEGKPKAFLDAWDKGVDYVARMVERVREGGKDNIIKIIVNARDEGTALSDAEMMAMMVVLLTGGAGTVSTATGMALVNLARNPKAADALRRDPALGSNVLDETLRLDPPVALVMRFTTEDTEIGGKIVKKGMPMYNMISAGCHDPAVFPDPYAFNIERENIKDHLAFGQGIHTCIGNTLTRAAVPIIVNAAVRRFPNLRLEKPAEKLEFETTPRSRHLAAARLAL